MHRLVFATVKVEGCPTSEAARTTVFDYLAAAKLTPLSSAELVEYEKSEAELEARKQAKKEEADLPTSEAEREAAAFEESVKRKQAEFAKHERQRMETEGWAESHMRGAYPNQQSPCGTYWGDWLAIGGRWSGCLNPPEPGQTEGRNPHDLAGHEDDAQVVDQRLYQKFLRPYEGKAEVFHSFVDVDGEQVNPAFIGAKWLVLVDLHC
jgi:hypothetical protein